MAKFILFLLALALVAASSSSNKISGAAAGAADEDGDLQQRQQTMAEVHRVFSNPASAAAADSGTVRRLALFLKREIGPLGPIFKAIRRMPEKSAADVRARDEAFDAAQELMVRHFRDLLVPRGSADTGHDDDLARRRQAMEEVARLPPPEAAAAVDAETTRRLGSFLRREMGPLEDLFFAIRDMPEKSAEDVRVKDEAFDAFTELLDRKFRLLLPRGGGCPKTDDGAGFAIGKMPENTAAEIRAKEEARAMAMELINRHLGQLRPAGSSVKVDDDL